LAQGQTLNLYFANVMLSSSSYLSLCLPFATIHDYSNSLNPDQTPVRRLIWIQSI